MAPRYAVSGADDPFKKYWWAILLGIGFTAMWLIMPMMGEKAVGSTSIDTSKPKVDENVEQSFADGEVGNGLDLSMADAIKKRKDDPAFTSSLMFPPPEGGETPADGATAGSAAKGAAGAAGSTSLAAALKEVGKSDGGWGEKKAQRGFDQPKLSGTGMSGLGSASGGRAGSAGGGSSAFGSANANVGFGRAGGLSGSVKDEEAPLVKGSIAALQAAASQSVAGANNSSNDAARNSLSQAFDGAKGGSKIGGPGGGPGGRYASLDTAPINLKLADPKLNEKKLEAPPMTDLGVSKSNDDEQMAKQMAMQLVGAVVGGMIGGPVGGIVTNVLMQAAERQMAQQEKVQKMEEEMLQRQEMRRRGLNPGPSTSS
ncbi:MAG: hypothetical protein M0D55_14165 [Elusimicrobiota bacterium]|nr:MAG: hypothetical protein M0D55_14165 [Elusimicrobiota bacterium]